MRAQQIQPHELTSSPLGQQPVVESRHRREQHVEESGSNTSRDTKPATQAGNHSPHEGARSFSIRDCEAMFSDAGPQWSGMTWPEENGKVACPWSRGRRTKTSDSESEYSRRQSAASLSRTARGLPLSSSIVDRP